jgi:hypothetical protein
MIDPPIALHDNDTAHAAIRTMIVCLPDEVPAAALAARQLHRHLGVHATSQPRFWADPHLRVWQRRHLLDLRLGRPVACAGGPVRLLDLAGLRHAAGVGAGIRHQYWTHVVRGTRPATPWHTYQRRHLDDPDKYPSHQAEADFRNQPRINAMRLHNATLAPTARLHPEEVEMFQAGPAGYQHYHALSAVCADAVLTCDGRRLQPDGPSLAQRVDYLDTATRHLDRLDPAQRILAVTL